MRPATRFLRAMATTALGVSTCLGAPRGVRGQSVNAGAVFDAGAMVRAVTRAHDEGLEAAVQQEWGRRAGRNVAARALLQATLARLAFRYDEADRLYRVAAADSTGRVGAWAQLGHAIVVASQGGFRAALGSFAQAAVRMDRLGDRYGLSEALIGQSLLTLRVVGLDSAQALLRAVSAAVPAADAALQARLECATLQVRIRGGARVADSTWQRVAAMAAPHGNRLRSECLFVRAQYIESLGLADASRLLLDTAAVLQQQARLWNGLSATRQWQGSAHLARGNHGLARAALEDARTYARRGASVGGEAWALQELGRVSQRIGAMGDAQRYFAAARPLFLASGDETGLLFADRALADAALLRRDFAMAESLYAVLGARVDRLVPQQRVSVLVARSDLARRRGRLEASGARLDSAMGMATQRNLPGWTSEIRYQRGLLALAHDQPTTAIAQWDTLLRQQNLRGPARFEVLSRWAEAQAQAGKLDSAWQTFGLAKRTLDVWSRGLRRREDMLSVLQDRALDWDRDLGLASMIARFANAERAPEALAMAEWRRVRGKEQAALQRGALQVDAAKSVGVVVRSVDTAALDARRLPAVARGRLPARSAIVSYVVGQGGEPTTAFLITRDTVVSRPLAPIDSLAAPIERFVAFLRAGRLQESLARALSDALLAPILATLPAAVERLVIVPDGELHRLPFAALREPSGAPLISRVEVAVAPSVEDALGSAIGVARRPEAEALLVGAPNRMPTMPGTAIPWPALPGAHEEVQRVHALLRHSAVLEGRQVVRSTLAARLSRGGPLLHVATHAVTDPETSTGNGLVITPSGDDAESGLFDLPALSSQPMPFDLVVLSACSSGDGVLFAGQALHGLVSTALDAGARGVVATRWRLDDAAIVPHMQRFYEGMLRGDDVVTALHRVRLAALHDGVSPAIWANLEYYGDPTLTLALHRREPTTWARLTGTVRRWLRALR